jgi:hypothetical protein
MNSTGLVIYADGRVEKKQFDGLSSLQKVVGGYIESVSLPSLDCNSYVNEEGRMKNLDFNGNATRLVHKYGYHRGAHIVGNMVILGPVDKYGEETSISEEAVQEITEHLSSSEG